MRVFVRVPWAVAVVAAALGLPLSIHHYAATSTDALVTATMAMQPMTHFRPRSRPCIQLSRTSRGAQKKWAPTRWDRHLDLAAAAHNRKHWGEVRLLCSRVIAKADDWSAVEQAHLRLALAEQRNQGIQTARRVFQEGTAACPSSDTLFMAWALMESKIHDERSRKVARALMHRAVALNPRRHAAVLSWRVFLDWKEAGEAAMEAVRSAVSNMGQSTTSALVPATPTVGITMTSRCASISAATTSTPPPPTDTKSNLGVNTLADQRRLQFKDNKGMRLGDITTNPRPRTPAKDFVAYWGKKRSEEKEHLLVEELLEMLGSAGVKGFATTGQRVGGGGDNTAGLERIREIVGQLEERGGGDIGETEGRELAGGWRLAFTTCTACNRTMTRTGIEVCERLSPPIQEITPRPGEPPVPFRCEVLVRPTTCGGRGEGDKARTSPPSHHHQQQNQYTNTNRSGLTYYLRGWAQVRTTTCERSGRRYVSLRQQVAPRTVSRAAAGGDDQQGNSGEGDTNGGASGRYSDASGSADRHADVWSSAPGWIVESAGAQARLPPTVLSALGQVARGRKGLETLVTQDVTYVGSQLRIGRTREGDVFVYERCNCSWPNNKWL